MGHTLGAQSGSAVQTQSPHGQHSVLPYQTAQQLGKHVAGNFGFGWVSPSCSQNTSSVTAKATGRLSHSGALERHVGCAAQL